MAKLQGPGKVPGVGSGREMMRQSQKDSTSPDDGQLWVYTKDSPLVFYMLI